MANILRFQRARVYGGGESVALRYAQGRECLAAAGVLRLGLFLLALHL